MKSKVKINPKTVLGLVLVLFLHIEYCPNTADVGFGIGPVFFCLGLVLDLTHSLACGLSHFNFYQFSLLYVINNS